MSTNKIWTDVNAFHQFLQNDRRLRPCGWPSRVVMTSCPADPLHGGHLDCFYASKLLGGVFAVLVNSDRFLIEKKGYAFMPLEERMRIVAALHMVDHVVAWDDGTQFVDGAIRLLKPEIFTKGGDRSKLSDIAPCEVRACVDANCELVLGVGGGEKTQSSSALVRRAASQLYAKSPV